MVYAERMKIMPTNESCELDDLQKNWLPLYAGELACGLFGITEDFVESYLSLDRKFMKNKDSTFFVRASGDSMEPEIKENDILIVDTSLRPKNEVIAAIFYNGNPICKKICYTREGIVLRSLNRHYQDIILSKEDDLQVFGVVIGLARDFS